MKTSVHKLYRLPLNIRHLIALALLCAGSLFAQQPEILGIGLSGSPTFRDVEITNNDSIFVVVSYNANPNFHPVSVARSDEDTNIVLLYGYLGTTLDSSLLVSEVPFAIDTASFTVQADSVPSRVTFAFDIPEMQVPTVRSLQIVLGLAFEDEFGQRQYTPARASGDTIGIVIPPADSVDFRHARFLRYRDVITYPPQIVFPATNDLVPRSFLLRYYLPEPSFIGRTFLIFTNEQPGVEEEHVCQLANNQGGDWEARITDAFHLEDSPDIASVFGDGDSLRDNSSYRIILRYEDINNNPPAFDTSFTVRTDLATMAGSMTEPQAGSSGSDTSILVIYYLPETMDSVWMIFAEDTASSLRDNDSPHRLLLVDSLATPGQHVFTLNGRNVGTGGRRVRFNPHGPSDSLIVNAVYNVTLQYGDVIGNPSREYTNPGYIYPTDQLTLRPDIDYPLNGAHVNESFYVQFNLPEQPLLGSVHLFIRSVGDGADPGSPRDIWLRTGNAGRSAFFLNGNNLSFSDVVDSVTGSGTPQENNRLLNQVRYLIRIGYRDSRGNDEAISNFRTFVYDTSTDPPIIVLPAAGDSFAYDGERIRWSQYERALPGTLKVTVRQTGGPEYDAGSPHVLYVTDLDTATQKQIILQPTFIAASVGIDSVQGGEGLVPRGIYECRVEYQDELANPPASDQVGNLYFPSGSTVFVRGRILGDDAVIPGLFDVQKFFLALRTDGGPSSLRGLTFVVDGDVLPTDVIPGFCRLWSSTDSVLTPDIDTPLGHIGLWFGGPMRFDTFAAALTGAETFFFVTLSYTNSGSRDHEIRLILPAADNIYCGGDPVLADEWPIGSRDLALPVMFTDFYTEQDTAFGALKVIWKVASETQNQGFNLYRQWERDSTWISVGTYATEPTLVGRGTAAAAWRYVFVDRGLVPGTHYNYRVEAVAVDGSAYAYEAQAAGLPQLPPDNFSLTSGFPNPFNGDVTFKYVVPYVAEVEIVVYDVLGRPVRKLVNALLSPAQYTGRWDAKDDDGVPVPSGIYFCHMRGGNIFEQAQKFVLIR